jgi:hypothetical protein
VQSWQALAELKLYGWAHNVHVLFVPLVAKHGLGVLAQLLPLSPKPLKHNVQVLGSEQVLQPLGHFIHTVPFEIKP